MRSYMFIRVCEVHNRAFFGGDVLGREQPPHSPAADGQALLGHFGLQSTKGQAGCFVVPRQQPFPFAGQDGPAGAA